MRTAKTGKYRRWENISSSREARRREFGRRLACEMLEERQMLATTIGLSVSMASLVTEGDGSITGTVQMSQKATSNTVINLISDDTSEIAVPSTVTILADQTTATFTITVLDDSSADGEQIATITASKAPVGDITYESSSQSITVKDNDSKLAMSTYPSSITEVGYTTVTLTRNSTSGELTVDLTCSDPTEAELKNTAGTDIITSVMFAADETVKEFRVYGKQDGADDGPQTVTITAFDSAEVYKSASSTVTVTNVATNAIMVSLSPSSVLEGSGTKAVKGTITLGSIVTASGGINVTISVDGNGTAATVTPGYTTIHILENTNSGIFYLNVPDDSAVDGNSTVKVTARASGYNDSTATLTVVDDDVAKVITVDLDSSELDEGDEMTGTVTVSVAAEEEDEITLVLNTTSIAEGGSAIGTVTLSSAATAPGTDVYLAGDSDLVFKDSLGNVIDHVTFAVGETSKSFYVYGNAVASTKTVTITATDMQDGTTSIYASDTALLRITDTATTYPVALVLSSTSVAEGAAYTTVRGTVTLSAPAGVEGTKITLTSSNGSEVTFADAFGNKITSITIDQGATSAIFYVVGQSDGSLGDSNVTITVSGAALPSPNTDSAVIRVIDDGDQVIKLTSTATSSDIVFPESVTIYRGDYSATFTITAVDENIIDADKIVTITATSAGYTKGTDTFTVLNDDERTITVQLDSSDIDEYDGTTTGTVILSAAAEGEVRVYITSSDTAHATVSSDDDANNPYVVIIEDGGMTGTFTITAVNDNIADGDDDVTIKATASGYEEGTATVSVIDDDSSRSLSVSLDTSTISEGDSVGKLIGTVHLFAPSAVDVIVRITTNDVSEALVAGVGDTVTREDATSFIEIEIPAGETSAAFTIFILNDSVIEPDQTVTFTATSSGYTSGSGSLTVTDDEDDRTLTVELGQSSISEGDENGTVTGTVYLAAASEDDLVVKITSSNTNEAVIAQEASDSATLKDDLTDSATDGIKITSYSDFVAKAVGYIVLTIDTGDDSEQLRVACSDISTTTALVDGDTMYIYTLNNVTRGYNGTGAKAHIQNAAVAVDYTTPEGATSPVYVTIAAGQTSATFTIKVMNDTAIDGDQYVTFTAESSGFTSGSASLNVTDDDDNRTLSVELSQSSISEDDESGTVTGTVNLAAAAEEDVTVKVTTSEVSEALLAETEAAIGSATLKTALTASNTTVVLTSTTNILANAFGDVVLTIGTEKIRAASANIVTTSITAGSTTTYTYTLSNVTRAYSSTTAAPHAASATVALSFTNRFLSSSIYVTIEAGQTSASFTVVVLDDTVVDGNENVTFTATSSGYTSGSDSLTVTDDDVNKTLTVELGQTTISEDDENGTVTGTVFLASAAGEGGVIIRITTSDPSEALFDTNPDDNIAPTSYIDVVINEGETSATFTIYVQNDTVVDDDKNVTFTATSSGYTSGSDSLTITDDDVNKTLTVELGQTTISEADENGTVTGTVYLAAAAEEDVTVKITSSDVSEALLEGTEAATGSATLKTALSGSSATTTVTLTSTTNFLAGVVGDIILTIGTEQLFTTSSNIVTASSTSGGTTTYTYTLSNVARGYNGTSVAVRAANSAVTVSYSKAVLSNSIYVTIAQGAVSGTFTVVILDDSAVDDDKSVTFTATSSGYTSGSDFLTVTDDDVNKTLTVELGQTTISEADENGTVTGTVFLASAAEEDITVRITTSEPSEALVGAEDGDEDDATSYLDVVIEAGQTSATFTIYVQDDTTVDGDQTATFTATSSGYTSGSDSLTVTDDDLSKTLTVELGQTTISESSTTTAITGTVFMDAPAGEDGVTVRITTSDPSEALVDADPDDDIDPTSYIDVLIEEGQTSATFTIYVKDDNAVDGDQNVTFTATSSGYTDGSDSLTVTDDEDDKVLTVELDASSIAEDATGRIMGTVTVASAPTTALTITISVNDTTEALLAKTLTSASSTSITVTIPANGTSATFYVLVVNENIDDGDQNVTISATSSGYTAGSANLTVTDEDEPRELTVELDASSITESGTTTGRVYVSSAVPVGGLRVYISSSDQTAATVSTPVTIAYGATYATFTINAVDDSMFDGTQTATITASADGYASGASSISVTDNDVEVPLTLSIADVSKPENAGSTAFTFTVALSKVSLYDILVQYMTSDGTATAGSDYKAVSGTAVIAAGKTSAKIVVPVYGDVAKESNETFYVTLSNATLSNATTVTIADNKATGTIENDDGGSSGGGSALNTDVTGGDIIGLYNPATGIFQLSDANSATGTTTSADLAVKAGLKVIAGDWDGDGIDTIGLYDSKTASFYLWDTNPADGSNLSTADYTFQYGTANVGCQALAGDWDNDGIDTVGVYNGTNSYFYLKDTNESDGAGTSFKYGLAKKGWTAIAGDWDGDGDDTVGFYNYKSALFVLNNNADNKTDVSFKYGNAAANWWAPIVGDWDGDGDDTVGFYNYKNACFVLNNNADGKTDASFKYGTAGAVMTPIAGVWSTDITTPDTIEVLLDSDELYEDDFTSGTVTLSAESDSDTTVTITSSDPSEVLLFNEDGDQVSSITVVIEAGEIEAFFDLTTIDDEIEDGNKTVTITAIASGYSASSTTIIVDDIYEAEELLATGGELTGSTAASLAVAKLDPVIDEATVRLAAAFNLDAAAMAKLQNVEFLIADLSGSRLGLTVGNTIYIDANAAGYGWFVDSTLSCDEEFTGPVVDAAAVDKIDLLSVVEHELGHVLGLDDIYEETEDLMSATLDVGTRRSEYQESVDAIWASLQ